MKSRWVKILGTLLVLLLLPGLLKIFGEIDDPTWVSSELPTEDAVSGAESGSGDTLPDGTAPPAIDKNGTYTSRDDVALYLWTYKELPANFITKDEARALGWEGGGLEKYKEGGAIGGDRFGNYEGLLPAGDYRECDIDTLGASSRGAKRIVYRSDCSAIYYTDDHYESFVCLYGEEAGS